MRKTEIFENVLNAVSQTTEIGKKEILSDSRDEEVVDARSILVHLLIEIGFYPGQVATHINKTPAGVRYLQINFTSRMKSSKLLASNFKVIRKQLESNYYISK